MSDKTINSTPLYHEEYRPFFLPALILLPFLLPLFWTYEVVITPDTLIFGYSNGLTRERIDRTRIESAEPIPHVNGLWSWGGGWGIRKNLKWETGYISKNGPAVRLGIYRHGDGGSGGGSGGGGEQDSAGRNDVRYYVFNCAEPERVCRILNKKEQ